MGFVHGTEIEHQVGDKYHVTGVTVNGRRFKSAHSNPMMALSINLFRGSVWQVRGGRRKLIKRVYN